MIAKTRQWAALFLIGILCACNGHVTIQNSETNVPVTGINQKLTMVIPALVSGTIAIVNKIRENKSENLFEQDSVVAQILTDTTEEMLFNDIQNQLAPPVQIFSVDNSKDTIITCEKGTKVFLPAAVFTSNSNSIEVSVQEFYDKTDLISRDLSTVSDGKILESGGTVKVTAVADGEWLEVKDGESYVVLFPKTVDGEMETFYGERGDDGIMDWTPAAAEDLTEVTEVASGGLQQRIYMADHRIWLLENKWRFLSSEEDRNVFQYFYEEYNELEPQPANYKYLAFFEDGFEGDEDYFCYNVVYDTDGNVTDANLQGRYAFVPADIDQSIQRFLTEMPPLDKSSMSTCRIDLDPLAFVFSDNLCFYSKLKFDKELYEQQFISKYKNYQDKVIERIPESELDYFILSTTEMGWINCDRFLASGQQQTMLTVESFGMDNVNYFMVFENFNAVVCASERTEGGCVFPAVPVNEPVKLVAFSFIGDQPLMAVQNVLVGNETVRLSNFQPFSIDELTAVLQ